MRFQVQLLGTNAALPTARRFCTSQILNIQEHLFMIDCGEGTQIRMEQFKVKRAKLNHIFISHLHGDHFFGLWGYLTSLNLNGRKKKLSIYSPPGLKELILPPLTIEGTQLSYPIEFIEHDPSQHQLLLDHPKFQVYSIPLQHRIPASGYLFKEKKRERNIIGEQITWYQLEVDQIIKAKAGEDILLEDGRLIPNEELTIPGPPPRSYAFCSDTRYHPAICSIIKGVDLLYHESTFLHEDIAKAEKTMHSTAQEAAQIAHQAAVGKLLLGHFSARYEDISLFEKEARLSFPSSYAPADGDIFEIPYN